MDLRVLPDADAAAQAAAQVLADALAEAARDRGRAAFAVSGGTTPWTMLGVLAGLRVDWGRVHLFQVDERVAPEADPSRNLTHLRESFLMRAPIPPDNVHIMPVEDEDLDAGAAWYDAELHAVCDGILDVVHLGLGDDGHTASLAPGDPVTRVTDRLVAPTAGEFHGERRLTLTFPALERARQLLFLLTGPGKAPMLPRLVGGDETIPAGRLAGPSTTVICDEVAASALPPAARS